jgi:predicted dehydrogenase
VKKMAELGPLQYFICALVSKTGGETPRQIRARSCRSVKKLSLEIFLEKGYMVLNGLITSSMSYGEEVLSVAKNRSTAPAATWKDEVITKYSINNSWRYEMEHFLNAIEKNAPITIGNSEDAFKLMTIIDKVYENKNF